jgi:ATP-dependent exoDNAse (exonuclease V) alpha subunit
MTTKGIETRIAPVGARLTTALDAALGRRPAERLTEQEMAELRGRGTAQPVPESTLEAAREIKDAEAHYRQQSRQPTASGQAASPPRPVSVAQPAPAGAPVALPSDVQVSQEGQMPLAATPVGLAAPPLAVAELCEKAGVPELTASMLRQGLTMKQAQTRIDDALEIVKCGTTLSMPDMGRRLMASGVDLQTARILMFDARASADAAIVTDTSFNPQPAPTPTGVKLDPDAVYARLNTGPR